MTKRRVKATVEGDILILRFNLRKKSYRRLAREILVLSQMLVTSKKDKETIEMIFESS